LTLQERHRQAAAIRQRMRSVREQLDAALTAMDYGQALAFQIEMHHLERELRRAEPRDVHEPYRP
jgi:hypothetical protein